MKKLVLLAGMAIASMNMFGGVYFHLHHRHDLNSTNRISASKSYKLPNCSGEVRYYSRTEAYGDSYAIAEITTELGEVLYNYKSSSPYSQTHFNYVSKNEYYLKPLTVYVNLLVKIREGRSGFGDSFVSINY